MAIAAYVISKIVALYLSLVITKFLVCKDDYRKIASFVLRKELECTRDACVKRRILNKGTCFCAAGAFVGLFLNLPQLLWREKLNFFSPYSDEQIAHNILGQR